MNSFEAEEQEGNAGGTGSLPHRRGLDIYCYLKRN
jgi:hypothetical protein